MQKSIISEIPRGVGAPPPPGMDPRKGKGKLMCIKVRLLDDSVEIFHLGHKANGQALFDEVCRHLNLLECDYFGLEFIDGYGNRCWLEKDKSILRQITMTQSDARFYFICKFYTPNPADLEEEYTRYLLCLQIRRDLAHGDLICNENTAALLVSFIVQAECGDFSAEDYPDHTYLSVTNFVPNQTATFQIKVMENHKKLVGMGPADADLALLETTRKCDFYGIKLHAAKDIEGTDVALSVAHMGIKVFHQLNCISTFSWAKIRKLSFKRKHLMIKLHPESYQYYKETIEFNFENRNECKNFWKKCVEHHAFFRCLDIFDASISLNTMKQSFQTPTTIINRSNIQPIKKDTKRLFSHGSSFRYQGRTQKQLIDYVREHRKRREPFERPIRVSSNRNNVDPYSVFNDNTNLNKRKIQFNIVDSTPAIGAYNKNIHQVEAYNNCNCPLGESNCNSHSAHIQQQHFQYQQQTQQFQLQQLNKQQQQYQYAMQPNAGPSFDNGRYSELYYPLSSRITPQQQQQMQQQLHFHQQQQQQQQHSYQYYSQYYNQIQNQAYFNMQKENIAQNQRPKSVYVTTTQGNDVNNQIMSKNYKSSGDVPSASINTNQIDRILRDNSDEPVSEKTNGTTIVNKRNSKSYSQQTDQMSTSLPNVLAEDLKVLCNKFQNEQKNVNGFFNNPPPKSMSGETFSTDNITDSNYNINYNRENRGVIKDFIYDNMSEGTYRLADYTSHINGGGNSSSQSDIGTSGIDSARVLSTTFTTKRVGNVIVKRVIDSKNRKDQNIAQNEDDEEDESLSSYSESICKTSTISAPAAITTNNQKKQLRQRLRNAIPIPVDSPPEGGHGLYRPSPPQKIENNKLTTDNSTNKLKKSNSDNIRGILKTFSEEPNKSEPTTTIIRPVLIDSCDTSNYHLINTINNPHFETASSSSILLRSRPVVVTPLSVRNPLGAYNLVSRNTVASTGLSFSTFTNTSVTTFAQQPSELPSKSITHNIKYTRLASPENFNEIKETTPQQQNWLQNNILESNQKIIKGIPGRVFSKNNMVITPEGILPKDEIIGTQIIKKEKEKPKVPPKPKIFKKTSPEINKKNVKDSELLKSLEHTEKPIKEVQSDLLAPLNSILNDVKQLKQVSSETKPQVQVSIQSEDQPQVQKLHMFGQIPYTLTMRNVEKTNPNESSNSTPPSSFQVLRKNIKSLDLVNRKQLPAQNSFSSQDHSISPTTPDSGNIVEYMMRRRSVSSDRYDKNIKNISNKRERRRQTQPIGLNTILPSLSNDGNKINFEVPIDSNINKAKNEINIENLSMDLPEPPPSVLQVNENKTEQKENIETELAKSIIQGILETDF